MTPAQAKELEALCKQGLEMVRNSRPQPPHPDRDGWIFRSDCRRCDWPYGKPPHGMTHGDQYTVMFHGGSKVAGHTFSNVAWGSVTAFRRGIHL
jgi:hypothetical protein